MKPRKLDYNDLERNYWFCKELRTLVSDPIKEDLPEFLDILRDYVDNSKNLLDGREYKIITCFLNSDYYLTLDKLAEKSGIKSRERVRQINWRISRKLGNLENLRKYRLFKRLEKVTDKETKSLIADNLTSLESRLSSHPLIKSRLMDGLYDGLDKVLSAIARKTGIEYSVPIKNLDWSIRAYNCLREAGIRNLGELTEKTEKDLLNLKNVGYKTVAEIKSVLKDKGLSLKY